MSGPLPPLVSRLYTTLAVAGPAGADRPGLVVLANDAGALGVYSNEGAQAQIVNFNTAVPGAFAAEHGVPVVCAGPRGLAAGGLATGGTATFASLFDTTVGQAGATALTVGSAALGAVRIGNPSSTPDQVGATDYRSSYDGVVLMGNAVRVATGRLLTPFVNSDPVDRFFQTTLVLGMESKNVQIGSNRTVTHIRGDVQFQSAGAGGALGSLGAADLTMADGAPAPTTISVNAYKVALNAVPGNALAGSATLPGAGFAVLANQGATVAGALRFAPSAGPGVAPAFEIRAGGTAAAKFPVAYGASAVALVDQDPYKGVGGPQLVQAELTYAPGSATVLEAAAAATTVEVRANGGQLQVGGAAHFGSAGLAVSSGSLVAAGSEGVAVPAGGLSVAGSAQYGADFGVAGALAVSGPVAAVGGAAGVSLGTSAGELEAARDVAVATNVAVAASLAVSGAATFGSSLATTGGPVVVAGDLAAGAAVAVLGGPSASVAGPAVAHDALHVQEFATLAQADAQTSIVDFATAQAHLAAPGSMAAQSLTVAGDASVAGASLTFPAGQPTGLLQPDVSGLIITVQGNLVIDQGVLRFARLATSLPGGAADSNSTSGIGGFNTGSIAVGGNLSVAGNTVLDGPVVMQNDLHAIHANLTVPSGPLVVADPLATLTVASNLVVAGAGEAGESLVAGPATAGSLVVTSLATAATAPVVYAATATGYNSAATSSLPLLVLGNAAVTSGSAVVANAYASASSGLAYSDGSYNPATLWQYSVGGYTGNNVAGAPTWVSSDSYSGTTGAYTGSAAPTVDTYGRQWAGEWVQLYAGRAVDLDSYALTVDVGSSPSAIAQGAPGGWAVLGSDDSSAWTLLDSRTGMASAYFQDLQAPPGPLACAELSVAGRPPGLGFAAFRYFRFVFTGLYNASVFGTRSIRLWGITLRGQVCAPAAPAESAAGLVSQYWGSAGGLRPMAGTAESAYTIVAAQSVVPTSYVMAHSQSASVFPPAVASMSWTVYGYASTSASGAAVQLDRQTGVSFAADPVRTYALSPGTGTMYGCVTVVFDSYPGSPDTAMAGIDVYGFLNLTAGLNREAAYLDGADFAGALALSPSAAPEANVGYLAQAMPAGLWGVFDAAAYDPLTRTIANPINPGSPAKTIGPFVMGAMPSADEVCLTGGQDSGILFPTIPTSSSPLPGKDITIIHVCRFMDTLATGAIITANTPPSTFLFWSGFYANYSGVAQQGGPGVNVVAGNNDTKGAGEIAQYSTATVATTIGLPWIVSSDRPAVYRANGVTGIPYGTINVNGGFIFPSLCINWPGTALNSRCIFQFKTMLVFTRVLSDAECSFVEKYLGRKYGIPRMGYVPTSLANLTVGANTSLQGASVLVEGETVFGDRVVASAVAVAGQPDPLQVMSTATVNVSEKIPDTGAALLVTGNASFQGGWNTSFINALDVFTPINLAYDSVAGTYSNTNPFVSVIGGSSASTQKIMTLNGRPGSGPVLVGGAESAVPGMALAVLGSNGVRVSRNIVVDGSADAAGPASLFNAAVRTAGTGLAADSLTVQATRTMALSNVSVTGPMTALASSSVNIAGSLTVSGGAPAQLGTGLVVTASGGMRLTNAAVLDVAHDLLVTASTPSMGEAAVAVQGSASVAGVVALGSEAAPPAPIELAAPQSWLPLTANASDSQGLFTASTAPAAGLFANGYLDYSGVTPMAPNTVEQSLWGFADNQSLAVSGAGGQGLTISLWIRPLADPAAVASANGGFVRQNIALITGSGGTSIYVYAFGDQTIVDITDNSNARRYIRFEYVLGQNDLGQWTHLAVVQSPGGTTALVVNGVASPLISWSDSASTSNALTLGGQIGSLRLGDLTWSLRAHLSDLRVWPSSSAPSPADIYAVGRGRSSNIAESMLDVAGAQTVGGDLRVTGASSLGAASASSLDAASTVSVGGNFLASRPTGTAAVVTAAAGLRVTGNAVVQAAMSVTGATADVAGRLSTGGAATFGAGSQLVVSGSDTTVLNSATSIAGNLSTAVGTPATLAGAVTVSGSSTVLAPTGGASVVVQNGLAFRNDLTATSIDLAGSAYVTANTSLAVGGNLGVTGSAGAALNTLSVVPGAAVAVSSNSSSLADGLVLAGSSGSSGSGLGVPGTNVPAGFMTRVLAGSSKETVDGGKSRIYVSSQTGGFNAYWLTSGSTLTYSTGSDLAPNGRTYAVTSTTSMELVISPPKPVSTMNFAAWIRMPSAASGAQIGTLASSGAANGWSGILLFYGNYNGSNGFYVWPRQGYFPYNATGSSLYSPSSINVAPGSWCHIAFVNRLDSSAYAAYLDMYVNGVLAVTMQAAGVNAGNYASFVSDGYSYNSCRWLQLGGNSNIGVSEVQFYNQDLASADIVALYNLDTAVPYFNGPMTEPLAAGFMARVLADRDENTFNGGTARVYTAAQGTLTASFVAGYQNAGAFTYSTAPDLAPNGRVYATVSHYPGLFVSSYSAATPSTTTNFAMWVKLPASASGAQFMTLGNAGSNILLFYGVYGGSKGIYAWPRDGNYPYNATGSSLYASTSSLEPGMWVHMAFVNRLDATAHAAYLDMYVSGELALTFQANNVSAGSWSTFLGPTNFSFNSIASIEFRAGDSPGLGLSEVQFYNTALSAADVRTLYRLGTVDPAGGVTFGGAVTGFQGTARFGSMYGSGSTVALAGTGGQAALRIGAGTGVGFNGPAGSVYSNGNLAGPAFAPFQIEGRIDAAPGTTVNLAGDLGVASLSQAADSNISVGSAGVVFADAVTMNGPVTLQTNMTGAVGSSLYIMKTGDTGGLVLRQGQLLYCNSDARIKTDIGDASGAACLDSLASIRVREYEYTPAFAAFAGSAQGRRRVGVIAQEFSATHPAQVQTGPSVVLGDGTGVDGLQTVNTGRQLYELIGSVQLLDRRMDSLEDQLERESN